MHLYPIPAGDAIPRAKMVQQYAARHTDLLRIDLHQIPGVLHSPVFRLANGPWPFSQFSPRLPQQGRPGRFVKHPAPLPIDQDASHHGGGDAALLAGEEHNQLVLAPTRILPAQRQNAFGQRRCPSGLAHAARPMRALFQGRHVVAVEAPLPAVKRLPADRKAAAGPRRISPMEVIEQHPLQPPLRCPAQALPEARQLARLGKVTPSNLAHPDTLQSVTNHSGRAQLRAHSREQSGVHSIRSETEAYEPNVQVMISCLGVSPRVPAVKPTSAVFPPTVLGMLIAQEVVNVALVTVSVMVIVSVVPS